ncbi:MAG: hypothetical protein ACPHJ3_19250, partial [Rubripirellula sp.]
QMNNTTDLFATLASVTGYKLRDEDATDSFDLMPVMLGMVTDSKPVRPHLLTQSFRGEFQIRQGQWKYLDHKGSGGNNYERAPLSQYVIPEKEPDAMGQLYDLATDPGETQNLYFAMPEKTKQMQNLLKQLKESGRSAPTNRIPMGIKKIRRIASQQ